MSEYEAIRDAMRAEFNARFDNQSTVLRRTYSGDAYNLFRSLCFEWYLSGFFDALTDGNGADLIEALHDVDEGRTTPIEEIRAKFKASETIH